MHVIVICYYTATVLQRWRWIRDGPAGSGIWRAASACLRAAAIMAAMQNVHAYRICLPLLLSRRTVCINIMADRSAGRRHTPIPPSLTRRRRYANAANTRGPRHLSYVLHAPMHDSIGRIDNSNTCSALVRCFFVFEQPSTSPTNATVLEPCSQRTNKATGLQQKPSSSSTVRAGTLTLTTTSCVAKLGDMGGATWSRTLWTSLEWSVGGAARPPSLPCTCYSFSDGAQGRSMLEFPDGTGPFRSVFGPVVFSGRPLRTAHRENSDWACVHIHNRAASSPVLCLSREVLVT
jgi:hypothetical protein